MSVICFLDSQAFIEMELLTDWNVPNQLYTPKCFLLLSDQVLEFLSFIYNWHADHLFFKHSSTKYHRSK